jgi:hypothetical protein
LVTPATLDFWKGRYYCKLFAFGGSDEAETAMANLAGSVARQIPETGSPPALLGLLPNTDRVEGSEKYFRRHLALNNIRYIDSENVFGLGGATEGVTADYRTAETGYTGYIIKYPTPAGAQAAVERYSTFVAAKAREASRNGIKTFILESGAIEAIALSGSYIVGIWDADAFDVGLMEGLLAAVAGED